MDKINVVILAGDRKASLLVDNDNKAFLKVKSIPCIIHTLKSFLAAEKTGNIVITGPKMRLEKTLDEYSLLNEEKIKIVEQRESLIENGEAGYIAALGMEQEMNDKNESTVPDSKVLIQERKCKPANKNFQKIYTKSHLYSDLKKLNRDNFAEIPVLISSCDIPVITPREIDEFIDKADLENHDYVIGFCREEALKYYYPEKNKPGMKLNYFHLREGNFRVNNMNIVKPLKIERLDYIEKMYEVRYQKKLFNMVKLLSRILFSGRGVLRAVFKAVKLHLALFCYDRGYEKFYPRFKESVRIDKVFGSISKILGTRASYVITSYGGAALDIDHPEDRDAIEIMFEDWIKHQENISLSI